MAHWIKVLVKTDAVSLVPEPHVKVKGENQFMRVVFDIQM